MNSFTLSLQSSLVEYKSRQKPHIHDYIKDFQSGTVVCKDCGYVKEIGFISPELSIPRKFKELGLQPKLRNACCKPSPQLKRALKLGKNRSWEERRVQKGEQEINRICINHDIPKTISERSIFLFNKAIKLRAFRTHYIHLIAQVCLYYAIKMRQYPLPLEKIINNEKYSKKLALKYYYTLLHSLNLDHPEVNPYSLISVISSKLKLDQEVIGQVHSVITRFLKYHNISGYNLNGVVAGAIYIACCIKNIPRSQQDIAIAAEISDITLRSRYKEIAKILRNHPI